MRLYNDDPRTWTIYGTWYSHPCTAPLLGRDHHHSSSHQTHYHTLRSFFLYATNPESSFAPYCSSIDLVETANRLYSILPPLIFLSINSQQTYILFYDLNENHFVLCPAPWLSHPIHTVFQHSIRSLPVVFNKVTGL